jgi:hypothetical protein
MRVALNILWTGITFGVILLGVKLCIELYHERDE